ncbi:MAG: PspA/IM30 family protein [Cyanobacteria bacterium P01_H01_bin.15]
MTKGTWGRIWRTVQAEFQEWVGDRSEPEELLEQAIADLEKQEWSMRKAVAQAIATLRRNERQLSQHRTQAEKWYQHAQTAVAHGDDGIATEALQRRVPHITSAQLLMEQLGQQREVIQRLKRDMQQMETKIAAAKTQKELLIARACSATASQRIQELSGDLNNGGLRSVFERVEDYVLELEAELELWQRSGQDSLEQAFRDLETPSTSSPVDASRIAEELQALKSEHD